MAQVLHPKSMVCNGQFVDLSTPLVMGIINLTPDSFYDGGHYNWEAAYLAKAQEHWQAGARIFDLGGFSTRSGATMISVEQELERLLPAIAHLKAQFPEALLAVDTFRAQVAAACLAAGAHIINDISGGTLDKEMFAVVAHYRVPYILMHMRGDLQSTFGQWDYPQGLLIEMNQFFSEQVALARAAGVNDIVLDPGFGFSKTIAQNYELMRNLEQLSVQELPLLVGVSRKSMIYKALGGTAATALNATTFIHTIALQKGAAILRVHDAKEAMECVQMTQLLAGE